MLYFLLSKQSLCWHILLEKVVGKLGGYSSTSKCQSDSNCLWDLCSFSFDLFSSLTCHSVRVCVCVCVCMCFYRQEKLNPAAQGTTRPQLWCTQLPGEWDHPADCAAWQGHGTLCPPLAERPTPDTSFTYPCHLGTPHPGSSSGSSCHHLSSHCLDTPSSPSTNSLQASSFCFGVPKRPFQSA